MINLFIIFYASRVIYKLLHENEITQNTLSSYISLLL